MKTVKADIKEFLSSSDAFSGVSEEQNGFEGPVKSPWAYLVLTLIKSLNPSWKKTMIYKDLEHAYSAGEFRYVPAGNAIVPDPAATKVIAAVSYISSRCPTSLDDVPNLCKAIEKFGGEAVRTWHEHMFRWIKESDHETETVSGCIKGIPIYETISPKPKVPKYLYRGMNLYSDSVPNKNKHKRFIYGTKAPACSWSESKEVAKEFGDYILTAKGSELLKQTVFLWPTAGTEMEIVFNLKRHLRELEWAAKMKSPMSVLSVDFPASY